VNPHGRLLPVSYFEQRDRQGLTDVRGGYFKTCSECRCVDAAKKRKKRILIEQAKASQQSDHAEIAKLQAEVTRLSISVAAAQETISNLQSHNAKLVQENAILKSGQSGHNCVLLPEVAQPAGPVLHGGNGPTADGGCVQPSKLSILVPSEHTMDDEVEFVFSDADIEECQKFLGQSPCRLAKRSKQREASPSLLPLSTADPVFSMLSKDKEPSEMKKSIVTTNTTEGGLPHRHEDCMCNESQVGAQSIGAQTLPDSSFCSSKCSTNYYVQQPSSGWSVDF